MTRERIAEIVQRHVKGMLEEITSELELTLAPLEDALQMIKESANLRVSVDEPCECDQSEIKHRDKLPKTCIATGCSNPNKGPRFKYLCADHFASRTEEQLMAWRQARKER